MSAIAKGKKEIQKLNNRLERLTIEYVLVESLQENSYNANRMSDHDWELLKKSIIEDGFGQPVLAQREGRVVIDGAHRLRCARDLGMTEIPVVFVDYTPEQMRIATLRYNRARGSEDIELTAQILRDLEQLGALPWAQDSLLLEDVELERLLNDIAAPEALAAEEFSQAWIPQGTRMGTEEGDGKDREIGGAQAFEGITAAASDKRRETEKQIVAAKSEEERETIRREQDIHRIAFTFLGDEAKIVKQALGDSPAQKLLEMCRAEVAHLRKD